MTEPAEFLVGALVGMAIGAVLVSLGFVDWLLRRRR